MNSKVFLFLGIKKSRDLSLLFKEFKYNNNPSMLGNIDLGWVVVLTHSAQAKKNCLYCLRGEKISIEV